MSSNGFEMLKQLQNMEKKPRRLQRSLQSGILLFLLFFSWLCFCPGGGLSAQTPVIPDPVTFSAEKTSLSDLIAALEKQVSYVFSYDKVKLSAIYVTNIHWDKVPMGKALEELQNKANLQYAFLNNNIAITIKEPQRIIKNVGTQERGSLKGRIVDFETSQPLPGATVSIQETGFSVLSDEKGYYLFKSLPAGVYSLTATYAGYQKNYLPQVRLDSGKQQVLDVKMQVGTSLGEVVVQAGARKSHSCAMNRPSVGL